LASHAAASGQPPAAVEAAKNRFEQELEELKAALEKEQERSRAAEDRLREERLAAEKKHLNSVAADLAAAQQAQANTRNYAELMQKEIDRLAAAQDRGKPVSSSEYATVLSRLMPDSIMGALTSTLLLGATASSAMLWYQGRKLKETVRQAHVIVQQADEIHDISQDARRQRAAARVNRRAAQTIQDMWRKSRAKPKRAQVTPQRLHEVLEAVAAPLQNNRDRGRGLDRAASASRASSSSSFDSDLEYSEEQVENMPASHRARVLLKERARLMEAIAKP
jgi:hypothetical protein